MATLENASKFRKHLHQFHITTHATCCKYTQLFELFSHLEVVMRPLGSRQYCLAQEVPFTPEALRLHRNTLTMELLWLQQAIDSRKKVQWRKGGDVVFPQFMKQYNLLLLQNCFCCNTKCTLCGTVSPRSIGSKKKKK